jgi:hypothetical protein
LAKFNFLQNALSGGEVTPLARGRTDSPQYRNSLEDCENMIPFVAGGAARRPGSWFFNKIASTDDHLNLSDAKEAFFPIELSDGTKFIVALGGGSTIKLIDVANNTSNTVFAQDEANYAPSAYETAASTYSTAQAQQSQYCQIGDILFIVSATHVPIVIKFFTSTLGGAVAYIIGSSNYTSGGSKGIAGSDAASYQRMPYRAVNTTATTIASSATAVGPTDLTASTGIFNAGHVGTFFKMAAGAIYIDEYTSSTAVSGEIVDALTSGSATTAWEEGAWSTYRGFPRTVGYYYGRVVYGGNDSQPDTLLFSQDGDPVEMSPAIGAAAACAERVSKINWMTTRTKFAFGTEREEFIISRPDVQAGFSITNIQIDKQTSRGSSYIQCVSLESAVYFVDAGGQRIVEFVFDERENSYRNRDINIFADHLFAKWQERRSTPRTEPRILKICKQSRDDQRIWVLDAEGGLFVCVIDRQYGMSSWSAAFLGGNGTGDDEDPAPFVRAICPLLNTSLPTTIRTGQDAMFISTSRSINNATANSIEYIDGSNIAEDEFYDYKLAEAVTTVPGAFTTQFVSFASSTQAESVYFTRNGVTYSLWVSKDGDNTVPTAATYVAAAQKIRLNIATGDTADNVRTKAKAALEANATFAASGITLTNSANTGILIFTNGTYIESGFSAGSHNPSGGGVGNYTVVTSGGEAVTPVEGRSLTVAGTAVSGLTWLKGETVSVIADGVYVGEKTVSSTGTFTLSVAATAIKVGFKYKSRIKTLPVEGGSQIGSALGSLQRIDQAKIHFYRSGNASAGSAEQDDDDNLDSLDAEFRPASIASATPTPLYTGYKVVDLSHDYERAGQLVVETEGPLAMTITHIVLRGQTYD